MNDQQTSLATGTVTDHDQLLADIRLEWNSERTVSEKKGKINKDVFELRNVRIAKIRHLCMTICTCSSSYHNVQVRGVFGFWRSKGIWEE